MEATDLYIQGNYEWNKWTWATFIFKLGRLPHVFGEQISGIYTCNEWKPHTDKYWEIMNGES